MYPNISIFRQALLSICIVSLDPFKIEEKTTPATDLCQSSAGGKNIKFELIFFKTWWKNVNTKISNFWPFWIELLPDLCLTLPCGVNAKCETIDNNFKCSCPSGLTGDPKTKCEGNHGLKRNDIVIYF